MAEAAGVFKGAPHERAADAAPPIVWVHGERTEQQRRPGNAGRDVPEPDGTDDAAAVASQQSEPRRRQPALAQALGDLAETGVTVAQVEQRFARRCVFG